MTDENKRHNIRLEVERADRNVQDARVLRQDGSWETAVSMAYYAAFHMARALLLMEGLEAKTHGGVTHLIRIHFVNPGLMSSELVTILTHLYGQRQDADYDAATRYTDVMADDAIARAAAFAAAARGLLAAAGYL